MEAIVCRSSEQIYEDDLVELHNRLTRWKTQLINTGCYDYRDMDWKKAQLARLQSLIDRVENVILNENAIDIRNTEVLGIKCSSMLRY